MSESADRRRRIARRPRRAVAAFAAVAAVATAAPADAGGSAGSFSATTTVESHTLPRSVATGSWSVDPKGTTAKYRMEMTNPSGAVTRVSAGWVSGYARSRGRCFGQYSFEYFNHRIVLPTPHIRQEVRYREQGRPWSAWRVIVDEDYQDTDPDLAISVGRNTNCVYVFPREPRRPVQLEIRLAGEYAGTHRIREDLTVTVP